MANLLLKNLNLGENKEHQITRHFAQYSEVA